MEPKNNTQLSSLNKNELSKKESVDLVPYELKTLLYRPDLKIFDVANCPTLTTQEKNVIFASLNELKLKFINLDEDAESWNTLKDILVKTIWESGINMPEEDQKIFIPLAIEDIKEGREYLTISDVRIALKNGVRRKYGKNGGEFFGINITTLNYWLDCYEQQTKITTMLKLNTITPAKEEKEYTEDEKKEHHRIWIEGVYSEFEKYKNTGVYSFYDFNSAFYEYAKEIGLVTLSEEDKNRIYDEAVLEYKNSKSLKNARSVGQRADFKHAVESLNKEKNESSYKNEIKLIFRKIVVRDLFKAFIKKEKDLKDMVEKLEKRKQEKLQS